MIISELVIFRLRSKEDGKTVGMIARKWSGVTGAVEDLATELDRFSVTFPEDATIQERADISKCKVFPNKLDKCIRLKSS